MQNSDFDQNLAETCSRAFSSATGLGCTLSDKNGTILSEHGYGCESCTLCQAVSIPKDKCRQAHTYSMSESERFGGKYIYFCPLGLTCFVSPIIGKEGGAAKITVGPFIMVDLQDFIDCELTENFHLSEAETASIVHEMQHIPYVPPEKVQELSVLLFMAVGFMNNIFSENKMLEDERSYFLQGQISAYISQLKIDSTSAAYPVKKERELMQAIAHYDREKAEQLLYELLGSIFAAGGGNLDWMKTRISELIVLISRTVIECGAEESSALAFSQSCQKTIPTFHNFEVLSSWLVETMRKYMDNMVSYPDARHTRIIHRCIQYIKANYSGHLTLEDTAKAVSLSPDYLSRIFKQETGTTFNTYLNEFRISEAKSLIRYSNLRLTDISQLVGYDDQSYFTKVFRKSTGLSPTEYRKKHHVGEPQTSSRKEFDFYRDLFK